MTYVNLPQKGTNKTDWAQAYAYGNNIICAYNDAKGTDGYQISGTAGYFVVIGGCTIVFAYYGTNHGIFIGTGRNTSITNLQKLV